MGGLPHKNLKNEVLRCVYLESEHGNEHDEQHLRKDTAGTKSILCGSRGSGPPVHAPAYGMYGSLHLFRMESGAPNNAALKIDSNLPVVPKTFSYAKSNWFAVIDCSRILTIISLADPAGLMFNFLQSNLMLGSC
jgi:hypothetical protein